MKECVILSLGIKQLSCKSLIVKGLVVSILLAANIAFAQSTTPTTYSGFVSCQEDGTSVSDGDIQAWVGGSECGTPSTFTSGNYVIIVPGSCCPSEGEIMFTVNSTTANEAGTCDPGSTKTLDLTIPCEPCVFDLDSDGMVGTADMLRVLADFGSTESPADFNQDGVVNNIDLLDLLANWGPCDDPRGVPAPPPFEEIALTCTMQGESNLKDSSGNQANISISFAYREGSDTANGKLFFTPPGGKKLFSVTPSSFTNVTCNTETKTVMFSGTFNDGTSFKATVKDGGGTNTDEVTIEFNGGTFMGDNEAFSRDRKNNLIFSAS